MNHKLTQRRLQHTLMSKAPATFTSTDNIPVLELTGIHVTMVTKGTCVVFSSVIINRLCEIMFGLGDGQKKTGCEVQPFDQHH